MIQSPVSEEDEDQPFGGSEAVEKGDQEEMEKSGKNLDDSEEEEEVVKSNGKTPITAALDEDLILKREHFVERRSSSESSSEFSLGPRSATTEQPAPAAPIPAPVSEAFPTTGNDDDDVKFEAKFEAKFDERRRSSSSSSSSSSVSVHRKDSTDAEVRSSRFVSRFFAIKKYFLKKFYFIPFVLSNFKGFLLIFKNLSLIF
jgi:hypothetical protein